MAKDCEGRAAGHHLTPGQGWRWRRFGDRLMLVIDGGGTDVVLSVILGGPGKGSLATCGQDGTMRPLTEDHPLALLLAAVPELVEVARDVVRYEREGMCRARQALIEAGLVPDPLRARNARRVEIQDSDRRPFGVVLRCWGPGVTGERHGENVGYMRREHAEQAARRWLDEGIT